MSFIALMAKLIFQHHYSSPQCPSEIILICWFEKCIKNISYYYQCRKQCCL